jgi:multidrug efflux pump subunit AcrA (membrane-fusion protein)
MLSGGIGWVASRQLQSPADVAARTGPPAASRIVAPVERRVLRSTLFTRGTVRFGSPRAVTLAVSAIKTGSAVITKAPVKGATLVEGAKAGDIGGRPVLVLEGDVPMYRDIRPGDTGPDVASLKAALTRLGYPSSKGDVFDGKTQTAVSEWMRKTGYQPFGPTETQNDRLRAASDSVRKAKEQVASAQLAVTQGKVIVTEDKILAADEAVQSAKDRADTARIELDKSSNTGELTIAQKQAAVATATAAISSAELALQRAQTDISGELNIAEAEQAVKAAQQRVVDADAAVAKANKAVESARSDAAAAALEIPNAEAALADAKGAVVVATAELERQKNKPAPAIEIAPGAFKIDQEAKDNAVRAAEAGVTSTQAAVRGVEAQLRSVQRASEKATQAIDSVVTEVDTAVRAAATAREQVPLAELRFKQARQGQGGSSGASSSGAGASSSGSAGVAAGASGAGAVSVAQAQQQLDQAKTAATLAQRELEQATKSLQPSLNAAKAAVRAADAQVSIAVAQQSQLSKPQDLTALRATLTAAQSGQREAQQQLATLQSSIGIVVPANEVLFFPNFPLRIDDTKLVAGDALSGAFMTVASQRLAIDASVDPADATDLKVGQKAEIEVADLNINVPATISKVASQTGTNGVDASRIYVELTPVESAVAATGSNTTDTSLPSDSVAPGAITPNRQPKLSELNGISVKVTIPISTTSGEVLVVPTAAVSAAADGTTRVEVETDPNTATKFVTVTAGLRAEGYVQVTPIETGSLSAGDQVVTGNSNGDLLKGTTDANDKPTRDSIPNSSPDSTPRDSSPDSAPPDSSVSPAS